MATSSFSPVCPSCGRRAPIVLRTESGAPGARCVACGAARLPLVAPSVTFAGQPSRVGGIAASFFGVLVLVFGLTLAVSVFLLLHSIWPASLVGWAFALPITIASLFFGMLLLFGGHKLRKSGAQKSHAVRLDAARNLLAHRGSLDAREAAQAIGISAEEADALLTELAKDAGQDVSLEVADDGQLRYIRGSAQEARFRVLEQQFGTQPGSPDFAAEAQARIDSKNRNTQ
ncbi:MAG TPA: hypothetical protein VFQ61_28855 [Polyangiaceae bacterium]|nr:hypothetical protein [Polyangiaceae bacterium]